MKKWYTPDEIWSVLYNVKTKEEFAQNWVVKGRFHTAVPEDILKSYKTVEYLMAHAWFHWPMFDEALRKLLGMVEMAVKFRCKTMGIDLTFQRIDKNGKGKIEDKSQAILIDQLCKKETKKGLKKWLHDVRWLRNYFAHPKEHSFMGGIAVAKIKNIVNLINLIFLDEAEFVAANEQKGHFEAACAAFKQGLFVLEYNQLRILVTEMKVLESFKVNGNWVALCFFLPVLVDIPENLPNHRFAPPPIIALQQPIVKDGILEANDLETGSTVKIFATTHPDNQKALNQHQQDWDQLSQHEQASYNSHLNNACGCKIRDFMYTHRWVSATP